MPVLAIILGAAVLLAVLEMRHQDIAGTIPGAPFPQFPPMPIAPQFLPPSFSAGGVQPAQIAVGASVVDSVLQTSKAASAAIPFVGAIASVAESLLAAHQARLKGATNENNAALQIVPVYDSFINKLVAAYNSGQVSAAEAANVFARFDQSVYQQLRSLVGAPGTAWSDAAGMAGRCDKTCTVSCCLYFSDLGPPLSLARRVWGDQGGRWGNAGPDPRLNGRTVTVPKVYPGKYSAYSRASYTFTLK
jgi:predicted RNA-binding Zn ribbon-like protein